MNAPDPVVHHNAFVNKVLEQKMIEGKLQRLYIPEILEGVGEMTKHDDKQNMLVNNSSPALLELLRLTYDPNIEFWMSPKEVEDIEVVNRMDIPDYDTAPATLFNEARRLIYFTKQSPVTLTVEKQVQMLQEMFSAMHEDDIALVKQMFSKKLKIRGLTENFVRKCFPNLLGTPVNKGK